MPHSPQLAEVEVYETRTPEVMSVLADGRPLAWDGVLDIPPGVRRLALELRIPRPGLPIGGAFRWRLPGEVDNWQTSRLMTIYLACPQPGRHVFEAQALHSDNQWDAAVSRLPIMVRQYFWETVLFRWAAGAGIVCAAAGLGIVVSRRRSARQLARMKEETALANERSRIARDIHDDLGVSLTQIAMQCEVIEDDFDHPERMRRHVEELSHSARAVTRAVDEIVWAVTPANDTLEKFTAFIGQYVENAARPAGLSCRLALPAALPDLPMEAATRHHLYLVIREAMNNVIRHAGAHSVSFTLALQDGCLTITLADDGCGFEPDSGQAQAGGRPGGGNGLANMRKRMEETGGTLEIASAPGRGTTLTLRLMILN